MKLLGKVDPFQPILLEQNHAEGAQTTASAVGDGRMAGVCRPDGRVCSGPASVPGSRRGPGEGDGADSAEQRGHQHAPDDAHAREIPISAATWAIGRVRHRSMSRRRPC